MRHHPYTGATGHKLPINKILESSHNSWQTMTAFENLAWLIQ